MVRRVRHFCRWLEGEGEADRDATAGIKTPAPGDPETPVLSDADLRALLATCAGTDFTARRVVDQQVHDGWHVVALGPSAVAGARLHVGAAVYGALRGPSGIT